MSNQYFGKKGEIAAERFMVDKGYKILDRNFRKRFGEIDLIALDPKTEEVVFIEVKTRKNINLGYPEEFVDEKKVSKIKTTAKFWLDEKKMDDAIARIDIIGIEWEQKEPIIHHWENIT